MHVVHHLACLTPPLAHYLLALGAYPIVVTVPFSHATPLHVPVCPVL
jgi:hypothetical protein